MAARRRFGAVRCPVRVRAPQLSSAASRIDLQIGQFPSEAYANICSRYARASAILGSRGSSGDAERRLAGPRRLRLLGYPVEGANYRTLQKMGDALGHLDRALRPEYRPHAGSGVPTQIPLDAGARRGLDLQPRQPLKRRLLRRGPASGALRAVRPGRGVARSADVADPRPHQRHLERQPAREPADRVPELRRDARHALRPQNLPSRAAACPGCGDGVHARSIRPSLLLADMLGRVTATRSEACPRPERRKVERPSYEQLMADVASMSFLRDRAEVRRLGQRGPQVDPLVRVRARDGANARRGGAETIRSR